MGDDLELQKNVISLKEETDDGFIVKYEVLSLCRRKICYRLF